jgi:hypothetical protein
MVKCPFCGFDNEEGALFCEQCKSDLAGVPAADPFAAPPPPMAAFAEEAPPMAGVIEDVPMADMAEAPPVADVMEDVPEVPLADVMEAIPEVPVAEFPEAPVAEAAPLEEPPPPPPMAEPEPPMAEPEPPMAEPEPPVAEPEPMPEPPPVAEPEPMPELPPAVAGPEAAPMPPPEPIAAPAPAPPPAAAAPAAAIPAGAAPVLSVIRGLRLGIEFPVYEGQNFIGRADDQPVDIDLEDQEPPERIWCSRQHALITFENGALMLEDLNSSNGTFLNRQRVYPGQPQNLKANDVIQIGTVQLKVKV